MSTEMFEVDGLNELRLKQPFPENMTTKQALQFSIMKWEYIVEHIHEVEITGGSKTCALCHKFLHGKIECFGCPVAEVTGATTCDGTPAGMSNFKALELAEVELNFLKALAAQPPK